VDDALIGEARPAAASKDSVKVASPSQPSVLTTETGPEVSLHRTDDVSCDRSTAVADTEGLSSSSSVVTSMMSPSADVIGRRGNVDETGDDELESSGDAEGTAAVSVDDGITSGDAESVCCETVDVSAAHDMSSHLNLGSILAESFVSSTHSAAAVVSTQATIGSPLADSDISASTVSSTHSAAAVVSSPLADSDISASTDVKSSAAPGICRVLLLSLLHFSAGLLSSVC